MVTKLLQRKQKHHIEQFTATISQLRALICQNLGVNIHSSKPAFPTRSNADQPLIQNIKNLYSSAVIDNKKYIYLFAETIPREIKMKDINSKIKRGRIQPKQFLDAKSKVLNHYVKPTFHECKYDSMMQALKISFNAKIRRNQKRY